MARVVMAFILGLLSATPALAQQDPNWGVITSFVPTWEIPDRLGSLITGITDDGDVAVIDVRGSEFRVGFIRGTELGGDWGVSFIQKSVKRGSRVAYSETWEMGFNDRVVRVPDGFSYELHDVTLRGVEYHRFRPITTIKDRVQIGLTYGFGVAQMKGTARGLEFGEEGTRRVERPVDAMFDAEEEEGEEGVGLFNVAGYTLSPVPLAKFELTVAGIVAPGLKVRASGGFNFPGYHAASVSVSYLFGSR